MSIFSALFGKPGVKTVTAHILDPMNGYTTEQWLVGRDYFPPNGASVSAEKDVYVINHYKAGKAESILCNKRIWLQTKAQFSAVDDAT